ncbi:MAG: flagellar biosynthesis protein FlgL, partial [Sulfurimonas sp.]|nr:flagellar biosynthesis protein FlgL [Sulfurimonas sp.]
GTKSDGTAFNEKIAMQDGEKIDELLNQIGVAYGNTGNLKVVNVSMNASGQIVIEDKIKGASKLDFHLVGAVDFSGGNAADVTNIDLLDGGETDFAEIINPTVPPANNLFVKEFMKSSYTSASGAATNIEGLVYDRVEFNKDGSLLSSNVAHVVKESNAFADSSTKLSEVADLSQGSAGTLDGTQFTLRGTTTSGAVFDAQIDLNSTGSTFSLDTDGDGNYDNGTYDIFDMANTRAAVAADEMTYQQLMDVVNIIVSENLPTGSTAAEYDTAVKNSRYVTQTTLSYDGKLQISDLTSNDTKASFAIFDANSGNFGGDSSVMAFHANNALTIKDPKTDFFKTINEMITAVENYKVYPDALSGDVRNAGIQNAIKMMDELQMHVQRSHSKVGANSNTLTHSLERTQTLEISTMTLRASIIDTDIAESSLKLSQLSLNYEAMLSMVGKVSKLSLVNYL